MRYLGLWYGGSSYSAPDPESARDREYFTSIRDAGRVLQARADNVQGRTPCVDEESCEMHLYKGGEYHENGPDVILTIGRRGGIKRG